MESERKVIEKLRNSKRLGVFDAMVLKKNSKRMECWPGFIGLHGFYGTRDNSLLPGLFKAALQLV